MDNILRERLRGYGKEFGNGCVRLNDSIHQHLKFDLLLTQLRESSYGVEYRIPLVCGNAHPVVPFNQFPLSWRKLSGKNLLTSKRKGHINNPF